MIQNILSSWTQSGHLTGKVKKIRTKPSTDPASFAYACYLSYLAGNRGKMIFHSPWVQILDCSDHEISQYIRKVNQVGWLEIKMAGGMTEVNLPQNGLTEVKA